jgi:hypothetical protein
MCRKKSRTTVLTLIVNVPDVETQKKVLMIEIEDIVITLTKVAIGIGTTETPVEEIVVATEAMIEEVIESERIDPTLQALSTKKVPIN